MTISPLPSTAREIILSLEQRFKADKEDIPAYKVIHFQIKGDRGGDFTATIKDGACKVEEGLIGDANCTVRAKDKTYEAVELGKKNAQMQVVLGKLKISDLGEMMKFLPLFERLF